MNAGVLLVPVGVPVCVLRRPSGIAGMGVPGAVPDVSMVPLMNAPETFFDLI